MSLEFYILRNGRKEGPLTEEEILDSIDLGDIEERDFCIEAASGQKRRIGEVFRIVNRPSILEPVPPQPQQPAAPPADEDENLPLEPVQRERDERPGAVVSTTRRPVYFGHPSFFTYWKSLLLATAIAVAGYYGSAVNGYFGVAGWLWASVTLLYVLIDRSTRDYVVTSKRVEVIRGLLSKSSREVRVNDIRAINVHTEGLAGLIGIGTVEFASAGTDSVDVAFENVWRAHRVKAIVRRLQDAEQA